MDVNVTHRPEQSKAELRITISPAEFKPYLERAAHKLSKDSPLKGFRPGKVALDPAIAAYGRDRVLNAALDLAMPYFFTQAVLDEGLDAISRPAITVTTLSVEAGLAFTATVDVLPEVTLGDATQITVAPRPVSVTDEDLERELKNLAKTRSTFLDVARPAQMGDTVTVDFKVSLDGAVMEGGESKNHPVHLGEGHFVPDFEQKLVGIVANDVRDFTITFPDDFNRHELRGKQASVTVKAHAVQKRIIPEFNDDFAKRLGKFTSLQHLKDELKKNMQRERELREEERYHTELAEKLAESSTFGPIPDVLVEREIDHRLEEFSAMLAYQHKTVDDYLASQNKTLAQIREEFRPAAEKAVKIGLALRTFADREEITVADATVQEKVDAYLKRFATTSAAKENVDPHELRDNIASTLRNQKTLQRLAELARPT